MDTQTQAQIYLADRRGESESALLHSRHTFNFGAYRAEGREPFWALCLLNDDTFRAGASLTMRVEQPTSVLLLPIVGGLEYRVGALASDFLEPGQVGVLSLMAGESYTLSNPYETEAINCLQLWLADASALFVPAVSTAHFDLTVRNTLLPLLPLLPLLQNHSDNHVYIGRYIGRHESVYHLANAASGLFVFVLQGAFEVANRLLQEKDGLSLLNPQHGVIEFEALSDDAILLLLDVVIG